MADQPDSKPVSPDENPVSEQNSSLPTQPQQPQAADSPPGSSAGWHEPPIPEESSRPVIVEAWFKPEDAAKDTKTSVAATEAPPKPEKPTVLPGSAPGKAGAWYQPLDAQLDALLSGAEDTIVETHAPQLPVIPRVPVVEETQPQIVADTQAQLAAAMPESQETPGPQDTGLQEAAETRLLETAEPLIQQEDTAVAPLSASLNLEPAQQSEATTPQIAHLTPAEQAMLEEQRAQGLISEAGVVSAEAAQALTGLDATSASQAVGAQTAADQAAEQQAAVPQAAAAQAAAPQQTAVPQEPSRFEQVEKKVQTLRERFAAGYLTREQLQNELRNLMILGDDGHWWMLGLETHQWYYYDGRNWVAATPPGYTARVQGSAVRTETGMQEVVASDGYIDLSASAQSAETGETLDDEMPLPRRVPQEDPGATLVSPSTPFLEPTRSTEAQTLSRNRAISDVLQSDTGFGDQTIETAAVTSDATIPGTAVVAAGQQGSAAIPSSGAAQQAAKPKPRLGEFPQPDYSDALGPSRTWSFYVKWGTILTLVGGMALTLVMLLAMIGYYLYEVDQYAEAVAELSERAASFENTIIYDAAGTTLAEFQDPNTGSRTEIGLEQISPWLIHATVATENETFYTDPGFSILAIVRAAAQNLRAGDTVSGASTITQQLARALVLETEFAYQRTTERKLVEVIVASEIKRNYTKNEILQIYLNEIFYGNYAYGIEAAAQTYFDKPASELNPIEAAFLAGLPQSPAQYDPVVNRETAIARMHDVLRLMTEANGDGCIYIQHQDTTEWAVPNGGGLCMRAEKQADGSVAYYYKTPNTDWVDLFVELARVETKVFSAPATEFTHPHFVNYVWQQLEDTYGSQAIYSAGYRVYTTLDESIQQTAETAVTSNLQRVRNLGYPANNTSVVAIRPSDGAVLAMVGSADYHNTEIKGQVNVAFTAQQPGSTLKPFIYLTAFQPDENGDYMTPATVLWDVYSNFDGYEPTNYDNLYHGPVTIRDALGESLNVPAVKALNSIGLLRFTETMTKLGVNFPGGNPVETNAGLPTALGAVDVQLFNLTAAYATLANEGQKVEPYSIVYIEDSKGNPIYEVTSKETEQVISPEYAYLITNILADEDARAAEFGYGGPMVLSNGRPAAIKTGTSNDSRDVWTIGYTPQLTVGVWVGTTDNEPMYNSTGYPTYYLTGYYGAAPLWKSIMDTALANLAIEAFTPPTTVIQAEVCDDSGAQPSAGCAGRTHTEIFAASAPPPSATEDIFVTLQVDSYTGLLANEYCTDSVVTKSFLAIDDATAYNWINNTTEGQTWAATRGIETPLAPAPNEYCSASQVRPNVAISYPVEGSPVQGVVELRGTVVMADFNRLEIRYGIGHDPEAFSAPLLVDQNAHPGSNELIGQIDTQVLTNGDYTLRLVVIDNLARSVTRDVHITVNNPQPTAMPTALPTPTLAPTLTPVAPGIEVQIPTATLAPTLTPSWTPTPTPEGQ